MQIHELNNFTGTLGSGAYLAIDDGTDTGKISSQGLLAATEARIDNIIAGPAPSAEEIVDARLGADGVTYNSLGTAIRTQVTDLKSDINDILIKWNIIDTCTIAEKTYDNSGTIQTNTTFYTCEDIPVSEGQVYYAYSVYTHTSPAYNHKVRKVNFYNGSTFLSAIEYADTWTIPTNATKMNVSMAYIGNDYANGKSPDDFITIYPVDERYNHLLIEDGSITEPMLAEGLDAIPWNAIKQGTILENTFIRPNGTQTTSTSFYCVKGIPVSVGDIWYAYSAYLNGGARFVTFYDTNGTAIGGYEYIKSWTIPTNAESMAVTFNYVNTNEKSPRDYATSKLSEIIQEFQLADDKQLGNREVRVATINFQFDDGNANDSLIFDIFNNNGVPCGFALISNISTSRVPEYLMYQRNGFEILSHSTDTAGMSSGSLNPSDVATKLENSRKTLESYGFTIRGWVTPYSEMNEAFIPLMARYYDFGTTVYMGAYDGTGTPYMTNASETTKMFRVSLQTTTLENQKQAVDEAIANNGFLTFYGHSADLDGSDYETTANLNSLLSYINAKKAQLKCMVLKPSDAVDYYFHVRHSDYLELLNN